MAIQIEKIDQMSLSKEAMMDLPIIRPATERDIDDLVELYIDFHEFHVRGVPDRLNKPDTYDLAALRKILHELVARQDAQLLVVDDQGTLVGLAEVYVREDEPDLLTVAHRYGHLQSLFVSASRRKGGLGKRLVEAAQQWAKEENAAEMRLAAWEFEEGPWHFYEALGYRTLKRDLVIKLA